MMEFFSPVGDGVTEFGAHLTQTKVLDLNHNQISPLKWTDLDEDTLQSINEATNATMTKLKSVGVETLEFEDYGGSWLVFSCLFLFVFECSVLTPPPPLLLLLLLLLYIIFKFVKSSKHGVYIFSPKKDPW
jgi:hypothetical protein